MDNHPISFGDPNTPFNPHPAAFSRDVGRNDASWLGRSVVVEVIISFGASVLKVAYKNPEDGFVIGTAGQSGEPVDFELDPELLGAERRVLFHQGADGGIFAVIADAAQGTVHQGAGQVNLDELRPTAHRSELFEGATLQRLGRDLSVEYELNALNIKLQLTERQEAIATGFLETMDRAVPAYFAASAAVFLSLMGSLAFFTPPFGLEDESQLDSERLFLITQYLDAASEREQERVEQPNGEAESDGGTQGKRAEGPEGEAGKPNTERTKKRAALKGPVDTPAIKLSRAEVLAEARTGGMIGLLSGAAISNPDFENAMFGRDENLGNSDITAQGTMWGAELGESGGMGGLGLAGGGFGALFGSGLGIGISEAGTIGTGTGKNGFGLHRGLSGGTHVARSPRLHTVGNTDVSGHIPPQVIQRVVRQNFGRFRMCYEQGLAKNPNLEGRVSVRFIIGNDGSVSTVSAGGDLPDQAAKSCVASAFYGISFPSPKDGIVKVTYPLMFSPE